MATGWKFGAVVLVIAGLAGLAQFVLAVPVRTGNIAVCYYCGQPVKDYTVWVREPVWRARQETIVYTWATCEKCAVQPVAATVQQEQVCWRCGRAIGTGTKTATVARGQAEAWQAANRFDYRLCPKCDQQARAVATPERRSPAGQPGAGGGYVKCPICGGTAPIGGGMVCFACRGAGGKLVNLQWEECSVCRGTGKYCSHCDGTGYVWVPSGG